jgi:probable phosphoglycerate mutase
LLFSHGHFLRALTARWLGLDASAGRCFMLDAGALSILGYEHSRRDAVIRLWNEIGLAGSRVSNASTGRNRVH